MNYQFAVYSIFLVSGISGLMYQVVWLRMLTRITGVTVFATAIVLAAFMSGLALGSFLIGRFIDKRKDSLRIYSILELMIAVTALVVPIFLQAVTPLYQYAYEWSAESMLSASVVRWVASFAALLLPTTVMGATLPVLTSHLVQKDNMFGKNFSMLYGLNTLGAFLGVIFSGFVTIGFFGEWATILIAASINIIVASISYFLYLRQPYSSEKSPSVDQYRPQSDVRISPYTNGIRAFVLVSFAISGFTALAYEVIWTRQLILFLMTSIYAFSGMLAIFLMGIALGSLTIRRHAQESRSPLRTFGILEIGVALLSVLNLHLFGPLHAPLAGSDVGNWLWRGLSAFVIVFPLTFVFGMISPVAASSYATRVSSSGESVGNIYALNTVGAIFGSLVTGFFLIPRIGSNNSVILLACMNLVLGIVLIILEPGTRRLKKMVLAGAAVIFLVLCLKPLGKDPFLSTMDKKIFGQVGSSTLFSKEGIEGTVAVRADERWRGIWINGIGMTCLGSETKLMTYLPILFTETPRDILVICFGMGTTVKSAALNPDLNVTAVDLVQETFESFSLFHPEHKDVLKREGIHLVTNDGRNHLLLSSKKYDVITVDPAPPIWSAGTVNLYSKEFLELCKSRLKEGGAMCMWFPGGRPEDRLAILRTFRDVFQQSSVWEGPAGWGLYFIGTNGKMNWDLFDQNVRVAFETPSILEDLAEYDTNCTSADQLYSLLRMKNGTVERCASEGHLITDNDPFTEFFLWRRLWGQKREIDSVANDCVKLLMGRSQ